MMQRMMAARWVRSVLRLLPEAEHADALQRADISVEAVALDTPVTVGQYSQLLSIIIVRMQTVIHGPEAEGILRFSCYRSLLEAMMQAPDLEQGLSRAEILFRRLEHEGSRIRVDCSEELASLRFILSADRSDAWQTEFFTMERITLAPGLLGHSLLLWLWHRLMSWLIGCYIELESVAFTDDPPAHPEKYATLFNAPVKYRQPDCGVTFSRRYLSHPIVQSPAAIQGLLPNFVQPLFEIEDHSESITARVRDLFGTDFTRPLPPISEIANRLHMSIPTLHRHLQKEGQSYQKIKNDCRRQAAIVLLLRPEIPIREVAYQTGFSDSGTFHRAFRKWVGVTPAEFRRSHL